MLYNFQNKEEVEKYKEQSDFYIKNGYTVDLIKKLNTRTTKQNSALHLLFTIISSQLNEIGIEFKYFGLKGKVISIMHTPHIVKEHVWRPLQIALFNIKSTKKINTDQINKVVDVLTKYFSDRGVVIQFPNKEQLHKLIN